MKNPLLATWSTVLVILGSSCGASQLDNRFQSGASTHQEELVNETQSSLGIKEDSGGKSKELIDLANKVFAVVQSARTSGSNIYVRGVSFANIKLGSKSECVFVQTEERKMGKLISKQTFVPASQSPTCTLKGAAGVNLATLTLFASTGMGTAAAVGLGAIAYEPVGTSGYIAGCAAGVAGVMDSSGKPYGTSGAFCSQIYDIGNVKQL